MYLIPQPKHMRIKNGFISGYGYDIAIDEKCGHRIFLAAKELKKTMSENGFGSVSITKAITPIGKKIILKAENKDTQGYTLAVDEDEITVIGESEHGLFFGIQTLRQIIMQNGIKLPYLEIKDSPDIAERGYYLDTARGRVPTVEGVKKFIDRCAFYKYTSFQIYIEHNFNWEGFEEIYNDKGYFTAEEIMELDMYCKERFIELVPSFASFGHLYSLLQSKSFNKYAELADYEPRVHKWQESREHHTIDTSNPESAELIKRMFDQVIPLFSSDKFNICCDETVDLGTGRGKTLADKIGKGQMYVNFILEICKYLESKNKKVMFWNDVIMHHEEEAKQLPKDITCLIWNYNYPKPEENMKKAVGLGFKNYICPWTAGAVNLIPQYHGEGYVAYENIIEMAEFAVQEGADGYLLTDWGDFGHTCHAELRYPMLALGGAKAWNSEAHKDIGEFDKNISMAEYGNPDALSVLKEISANTEYSWNDIVLDGVRKIKEPDKVKEDKKELCENYKRLCELEEKLAALSMNESRDVLLNAAKGVRLVTAIKCANKYPVMPNEVLANEVENWCDEFARVWRKDNKESELHEVYKFLESHCVELRTVKA